MIQEDTGLLPAAYNAFGRILPVKLGVLLGMYLGAFNFMDAFKGRIKKEE